MRIINHMLIRQSIGVAKYKGVKILIVWTWVNGRHLGMNIILLNRQMIYASISWMMILCATWYLVKFLILDRFVVFEIFNKHKLFFGASEEHGVNLDGVQVFG